MKRKSIPSYLPHKQSGRARAVWTDPAGNRRDRLLPGAFGSSESRAAYRRLLLELESSPHQVESAPDTISISELLLAYIEFAEGHYRHADGRATSELYEVKIVVKAIREMYGERPVAGFGPLAVKAIRQQWVNDGRSRGECNRRVGIVKRILKWGTSEELVPAAVYQSVATVSGLQRGRTEAKETEPVGPVEDSVVDATLPHLNRHVRGLVEFQRLTGARPGEACSIRRCDIDTGGAVWLYTPTHHKTAWRGKSRTIAIGPKAQTLLRQFFTTNIEDYLFSPRRAMEELLAERHENRVTPKYPSHLRRNEAKRTRKRARPPKERYDRTSYTRAIARATEAAGVEHWHPNQLRHLHGTRVRKLFSLEHAGAALGHTKMSATEIYAERDAGLALEVAAQIG